MRVQGLLRIAVAIAGLAVAVGGVAQVDDIATEKSTGVAVSVHPQESVNDDTPWD